MKAETDVDRLRKVYEAWPDEQLIRSLTAERQDFDPQALRTMQSVLDSRGVPGGELEALVEQVKVDTDKETARLNKVRGVLLFFVLVVGGNSLIQIWTTVSLLMAPNWLVRAAGIPAAFVGLYGLRALLALVRKQPGAPQIARRWIGASVALGLELWVVEYALTRVASARIVGTLAFATIWLAYLAQSKRVRTVYGGGPSR